MEIHGTYNPVHLFSVLSTCHKDLLL